MLAPFPKSVEELGTLFGRPATALRHYFSRKKGAKAPPKGEHGYNAFEFRTFLIEKTRQRVDSSPIPTERELLLRAKRCGIEILEMDDEDQVDAKLEKDAAIEAHDDTPSPSGGDRPLPTDPEGVELERRRRDLELKVARAESEKLKLEELRGELVPVKELRSVSLALVGIYNRALDNLASSLPTELQHREADEIEGILAVEHRTVKSEAARLAKEDP